MSHLRRTQVTAHKADGSTYRTHRNKRDALPPAGSVKIPAGPVRKPFGDPEFGWGEHGHGFTASTVPLVARVAAVASVLIGLGVVIMLLL